MKLPIRPHFGANRGELEWRRPNRVTLLNLLHHPIYAGAYRWGHREVDPRKKVPGKPSTGRTFNAYDQCRVLIRDRFPAYIGWEEFERNQQKLRENSALGKLLAAPRHGPSVLAGLVVCGRCGHRMLVGYANAATRKTLRYSCQRDAIDYGVDACQSLSGAALESFVVERLLQAVSPASLELSLAATADVERERKQLDDHWQQRLTRSRYEVEQARRQYAAVDPDHRLVARELERRWDEALRANEALQVEYDRFASDCPRQLSPHEREQIRTLADERAGAVARRLDDSRRSPNDRATALGTGSRDRRREHGSHRCRIALGGRLRQPSRAVSSSANVRAVVELSGTGGPHRGAPRHAKTLSEIAATLNAEGFRPPKRSLRFTQGILSGFLRERGVRIGPLPRSVTDEQHLRTCEWWLADLAAELSMPIATLHRWRRVGWLASRKVTAAGGRWAIYADADELLRLRRLRDCPRGWPQPYPLN